MSRSTVALIVLIQCAALFSLCLFIGDNAWDDGAITLAFAKTFALHGRVALTPRSEIVEGFSSVSWFLLNALVALARPSFRAAIAVSQALSVLSIGACTVLLARTCTLLRLDRLFATLTLVAFAAWGCAFSEAANGMEMGLLACACLVIINELLADQPRLLLLAAGVALAITTRFEAVLYVGLFGASAFSVGRRRAGWAIVLSGAVTVAVLSAWRWATFSDLLPNTFWAKRWPPYAALGPWDRLVGAVELLRFFVLPMVALLILGRGRLRSGDGPPPGPAAFWILGAPVLAAVGMGLLTGRHWGYVGRMPYFAFPPALALLGLLCSDRVDTGRPGRRRTAGAVAFGLAVASSMVGLPLASLAAARSGGGFGVTPHSYAESGQVFRRFAAAANLQHAAVLTSDVGGLSLCCDELRVVDLAFLSNRRLAHQGPSAIGEVLQAESPDLIEAHWKWAAVGKLYQLPGFRAHYAPAFTGGTKLWIRRDLAERIAHGGRGCWAPLQRDDVKRALGAHRYSGTDLPDDRTTFQRDGLVFALDQPEADGANLCGKAL